MSKLNYLSINLRHILSRLLVLLSLIFFINSCQKNGRNVTGSSWATYRNDDLGYELQYPHDWEFTEAKPRTDDLADWSGKILFEEEVQKITFLEKEYQKWQGSFQVRVLQNTNKWDIDQWSDNYLAEDYEDDSLIQETTNAVLDRKPAKKFTLFMFDHQGIELVTVHNGQVYQLIYAGSNPNDDKLDEHMNIYNHMVSSFKFNK